MTARKRREPTRTGNVWTTSAHVITAVIGSGVLSLGWSIAQVGWATGPLLLLLFAAITFYASILLSDCYRSPDFSLGNYVEGKRNPTYIECVKTILGNKQERYCAIAQTMNLVGSTIAYTITSATSMVAIDKGHCIRRHSATCTENNSRYVLLFGLVQIVFSQIPDIHRLWWLSILAAVMSFAYSLIGLGLSAGTVHGVSGTLWGVDSVTTLDKVWGVLQALGNIAFAYSFSSLLIEIQNTIKSPPAENVTMKKAISIGVSLTTVFYVAVGCVAYAAFGNDAPGNLLTGFSGSNLYWLVDIANICIIVHLIGGYQVYAQPVFAAAESLAYKTWPHSRFVATEHNILGIKFTAFNVVWRTGYVVLTTFTSLLFPFFTAVMGLLGALTFWPLTVYFPVEMYCAQYKVSKLSSKGMLLRGLSLLCLIVSLLAAVGSIQGIITSLNVQVVHNNKTSALLDTPAVTSFDEFKGGSRHFSSMQAASSCATHEDPLGAEFRAFE